MTDPERPSPLIQHLLELRRRLMVGVGAMLLIWCVLLFFANDLFAIAARPLMQALPPGTSMIATGVAAPFIVPFKLAAVAALFLAFPILLMQVWAFIAPGLYAQERRMLLPLFVSSVVLFYAGVAFAYFGVFPFAFRVFVEMAPPGVVVSTDIGAYLDFALVMFFAFGLAFEVPVATVLLVWAGVTTPAGLARARSWVLIGAFVVGAVLTPPDPISQTMMALPMYLLYEFGIVLARVMVPGAREREAQEQEAARR